MKKILFLITQGQMGGAQQHVLDLVSELPRERYEILLVSGKENLELIKKFQNLGLATEPASHLVRRVSFWHDLLAIFEIKNICKGFKPDILHLHSSKAGVIGSLAGKLAGVRIVIFTAHGFHFLEPGGLVKRKLSFYLEKFASLFRDKIICVSEFDRQQALKSGLCEEKKLVTIHNGIVIGSQNTNPKAKLRKAESQIIIGTLAHDYPSKDLATLRAAFEMVKREFPNIKLKIMGRGSTSGEASNGRALLSTFDIYACSSVKEGFPYSILQAMAAGLPIVSTAVGGIPEMLGNEAGILVPPRNPQALAAGMKKILLEPELATKLSIAAQKKVQSFTLDHMVLKTRSLYDTLSG